MPLVKKKPATKFGIYTHAENWDKNAEGVRPQFPFMPQAMNSIMKDMALGWASILGGSTITKVRQARNKIQLALDTTLPKQIAGCSTQYVIMLNHILNGDDSWYGLHLGNTNV